MKLHNLSKRARLSLAGLTGAVLYRRPMEAEADSSETRGNSDPMKG